MNAEEAAILCRYVAAGAPQQKIDEFTPAVWADLLVGVRLVDAKDAVRALLGRQPFVAPAEVIAEVKRIRSKRIAEHPAVIPPANLETFAEQQAWQRELNRRIGDGETFEPNQFYAGELKPRDLRELRALQPAPTDTTASADAEAVLVSEETR